MLISEILKENEEYLERQREAFREFLFDDSYAVRIVACKSALSILASYWITFDNAYIGELLTKVSVFQLLVDL